MNVSELIEILKDQPEDAEVRLAIQPEWAFEHSISGVVGPEEVIDEVDPEEEEVDEIDNVVYIGEGHQLGYLPSAAGRAVFNSY